jgi:hypothetical protein
MGRPDEIIDTYQFEVGDIEVRDTDLAGASDLAAICERNEA